MADYVFNQQPSDMADTFVHTLAELLEEK